MIFKSYQLKKILTNFVYPEIFLKCLSLGYSLKAKADETKAQACIFYVLADISHSILFKAEKTEIPELRKMFISVLGRILVDKEDPNYETNYEKLDILRIRSELIDHFGKFLLINL